MIKCKCKVQPNNLHIPNCFYGYLSCTPIKSQSITLSILKAYIALHHLKTQYNILSNLKYDIVPHITA